VTFRGICWRIAIFIGELSGTVKLVRLVEEKEVTCDVCCFLTSCAHA
jgi:hypothetical protein